MTQVINLDMFRPTSPLLERLKMSVLVEEIEADEEATEREKLAAKYIRQLVKEQSK